MPLVRGPQLVDVCVSFRRVSRTGQVIASLFGILPDRGSGPNGVHGTAGLTCLDLVLDVLVDG